MTSPKKATKRRKGRSASKAGLGCNTGRLGCCIREAEEFEAVRVEPVVGHKDLPGGLALALAVQKGEWPHTMDAQTWATAWMLQLKETPEIYKDEGAMICWFANAIMAGYDTAEINNGKGKREVPEFDLRTLQTTRAKERPGF